MDQATLHITHVTSYQTNSNRLTNSSYTTTNNGFSSSSSSSEMASSLSTSTTSSSFTTGYCFPSSGRPNMLLFLFLAALLFGDGGVEFIHCKVHTIGDSAGWTIIGNVNYTAWSSSKTFHVGDTIYGMHRATCQEQDKKHKSSLFVYNEQFHNVLEVNKADYRTCNASHPIATYTSGNDSVVLRHKGHHFFICGVPTHCQIGQKVDIRIPKRTGGGPLFVSAPAPAPMPSSLGLAAPPQESGGSKLVWSMAALVFLGGFGVM